MKMKLSVGIILGLGLLITSCKKEGCMDIDAKNYNSEAKKDDGTCTYEGKHVVWYGESAADGLVADGATSLTYFVDGSLVGSGASNVFWTSSPTCGQDGSVTITKDLGSVKTQSYTYSVIDQTGWEYWSGIMNFNANTCTEVELTW
ncbi:MAG: hypothetical protein ACI8ZM_001767 [Crocinitomix sp.]|jgi:hypothetical protein